MAYDPENVFAKILRGDAPAHKVFEDEKTLAFMDIMPQTKGHTLVVPKCPVDNIFDIDPSMLAATILTTRRIARAVRAAVLQEVRQPRLRGLHPLRRRPAG